MSSRSRGSISKKKQKIHNDGQFLTNTTSDINNAFPGSSETIPPINGYWWFPWAGTPQQEGRIQENTNTAIDILKLERIGQAVIDPTNLQGVRQVSNIHFEIQCSHGDTTHTLIYGFQWFLMKMPQGIDYQPLIYYPGDNRYKFFSTYTNNWFFESYAFGNAGPSNGVSSLVLATGLISSNPFDSSYAQVNIPGPITLNSGDQLMTCVRNVDPFGDAAVETVEEQGYDVSYLTISRVHIHDRLKFIWSFTADVSY